MQKDESSFHNMCLSTCSIHIHRHLVAVLAGIVLDRDGIVLPYHIANSLLSIHTENNVKGNVQRKVRWVESGLNRWLVLQCGGAGCF